jgi:hypothetical protein
MSQKMMKTVYAREIRHIIANFSSKSASTGFRRDSISTVHKSVYDMIKWNWIECTDEKGQFIFVRPTESFLSNLKIIL